MHIQQLREACHHLFGMSGDFIIDEIESTGCIKKATFDWVMQGLDMSSRETIAKYAGIIVSYYVL